MWMVFRDMSIGNVSMSNDDTSGGRFSVKVDDIEHKEYGKNALQTNVPLRI